MLHHALALWTMAGGLADPVIPIDVSIDTPMAAPAWATLERQLLREGSKACDLFAAKYLDARGWLLHTPRWGALDGADDAIETFHNWTLLHALGGSDSLLAHYRRALEGHLEQYKQLRTTHTELAKDGAYHDEFLTYNDWFHIGEGMRAFMLMGLSAPRDPRLVARMKRFAELYMGGNPKAPNYDPKHKVIRSIWTGSRGPLLRQATPQDWAGDPIDGRFNFIHSGDKRAEMLDAAAHYPRMLAHFTEYGDSAGDTNLNLAATGLGLNAFALSGQKKYRDWVVSYVDAWKARAAECDGNIPSNVGLDGKVGSTHGGRWWKGTYGWNFSIFDGEIAQMSHRNYFVHGSWPGFGNAYLLTGDPSFIATLRRQMDNIYAQKKVEGGKVLLPQMYGDPRGYQFDGKPTWYHYTDNLFTDRLTEIYLWSMDRRDLERVPKTGWIGFLEGADPAYPEKALRHELDDMKKTLAEIAADPTKPETRLADYLLELNPARTLALTNLMLGGTFAGRIWTLHARVRYFDPRARRAGVPEDVAALVEKLTADQVTLTLVNTSATQARAVIVQAGAYAEHRIVSATVNGKNVDVGGSTLTVSLAPGSGGRVVLTLKRYANPPTFAFPWDRR
jgi:hypothetical protein